MISFIIPTYNEEAAIAATIQKLRKEFTLVPYEIIVADDQSTDNTVELAKPLADKVVVNEKKFTIAANRNSGAKAAKYPLLVFMDCGVEIPDPNKFFEHTLKHFKDNPKLAGLAVKIHINPSVRTKADAFFTLILDIWFFVANKILRWGLSPGKFQMIKAESFARLKGYNENMAAGEDNDFFTRLKKAEYTHWEKSLTVFHLGRREHALGWPRLMTIWFLNGLWVVLFKRSYNQQWKAVR